MMNAQGTHGNGSNGSKDTPPDIKAALERLEAAVHRLAATATKELAGRAVSFIDEAAAKLERELWGTSRRSKRRRADSWAGSGVGDERPASSTRRRNRRSRRRRSRSYAGGRYEERRANPRTDGDSNDHSGVRRLVRDRKRAKIGGVCAGIANYLGAEVWVVRCVAVTGLIFMSSIVFPAYWILFFIMSSSSPKSSKRKSSERKNDCRADNGGDDGAHALGPGTQHSPRRRLGLLRDHVVQAELRLRRMESHVTSGQYELQRELNKLDGNLPNSPGS